MKKLSLTLILISGITLQNCFWMCNCPNIEGEYIHIQGIRATHASQSDWSLDENTTLDFKSYIGLNMQYEVEYVGFSCDQPMSWLGNALYACSCIDPGELGSKNQRLQAIWVECLTDFDSLHLKGDTLNDLLRLSNRPASTTIEDYIAESNTIYEGLVEFSLLKRPELDNALRVKMTVELSTGEVYSSTTPTIYFTEEE